MFWHHILWLTADSEGIVVRCTHRQDSPAQRWYTEAVLRSPREERRVLMSRIDWDQRAEAEGFSSIKDYLQAHIIKTGTVEGAADSLGVCETTLRRKLKRMRLGQFRPKDWYAWSKGYPSMKEMILRLKAQGLSPAEIEEEIEGFQGLETIYQTLRR